MEAYTIKNESKKLKIYYLLKWYLLYPTMNMLLSNSM